MRWTAAACVAACLTATEAAMAAVIDLGDIPRGVTQTLFTYDFPVSSAVDDTYRFNLVDPSVIIFERTEIAIGPQPLDLFDDLGVFVFNCDSPTFCMTGPLTDGIYALRVTGVATGGATYSWKMTTTTPIPAAAVLLGSALLGLGAVARWGRSRPQASSAPIAG
jgi:hypothetical protein